MRAVTVGDPGHTKFVLALALVVAPLVTPPDARAQEPTVIEKMIAAQNPCSELKTKTALGITIGIDKLDEVTLNTASASLDGNDVSLGFDGRLACRTSDAAVVKGNAATSVVAKAKLSLKDCAVDSLTVTLSEFGGTFGPILEAFAPALEQEIAAMATSRVIEACRAFRGDAP